MCDCMAGQRNAGAEGKRFLLKLRHAAMGSHLIVAEIAGVKDGPSGYEVGHGMHVVHPQFEILWIHTHRSRK